jgi:hypothetical protein
MTITVSTITALTGLLGVILGIIGVILNFFYNKKTIRYKSQEEEKNSIYNKINSFYAPFIQISGENHELYQIFRFSRKDEFRTLITLLQGEKFDGNDKVLLEQIINNSSKLETLILEHSGLIDDKELRQLLWIAGTHYRLIQLAFNGAIIGDIERFKYHVYPRNLDTKVDEEISKLKQRLEEIRSV